MMKRLILIYSLFSFSLNSTGQSQLYYACTENKELLKLNPGTCDTTFIGLTRDVLFDIALTPDRKLYGLSYNSKLYELDTSNANMQFIASFNIAANSLVSDSAGNLLTVSNDTIYQIDRFTGQIFPLGYFGNYLSAGDLTFYHDTLYLTATSNLLIKIILQPVISSQVVGQMSITNTYGINTVCINGTESMIASGGDYNYSSLYTVNPTNAIMSLLCDSITHVLIFGATSQMDFGKSMDCFISSNIEPIPSNDLVKIFPNPVSDILNVSYNNSEPAVFSVFDVTSKQLIRKQFMNSFSLDISTLSTGVYFFQLENAEFVVERGKFFKQKN